MMSGRHDGLFRNQLLGRKDIVRGGAQAGKIRILTTKDHRLGFVGRFFKVVCIIHERRRVY